MRTIVIDFALFNPAELAEREDPSELVFKRYGCDHPRRTRTQAEGRFQRKATSGI